MATYILRQYKYLQKVGSPGKVNRILQIIYMYYFCSIRHRRSHLVIFWVLLLLIKISFPPKQNSSHWCRWRYYSHMHYNYYWCYKSPAPRSCWVHPWIRWCTKFGHFMHFWQNYRQKILKGLWFFFENGHGSTWWTIRTTYFVYIRIVFAGMNFYLWCDWDMNEKAYDTHFEIEHCSNIKTIAYVLFFFIYSILQIISGRDDMICSNTINHKRLIYRLTLP